MIRKRPGSQIWWLDVWVGKKRLRRSLRTDDRALALERARDLELELRRPRSAGLQIEEFFCKYRAWARETKPASYRNEDRQLTWIAGYFTAQNVATLEEITP